MRGGILPIYLSPQGVSISREQWQIHVNEGEYLLRQFESDNVLIRLYATDRVPNGRDIPPEFWKRFEVVAEDIVTTDDYGCEYVEPKRVKAVDGCKQFRTRKEAEEFYETYLAQFTKSSFDPKTGKLVEVGNKLAPPDPDKPVVAETSPVASEYGSW